MDQEKEIKRKNLAMQSQWSFIPRLICQHLVLRNRFLRPKNCDLHRKLLFSSKAVLAQKGIIHLTLNNDLVPLFVAVHAQGSSLIKQFRVHLSTLQSACPQLQDVREMEMFQNNDPHRGLDFSSPSCSLTWLELSQDVTHFSHSWPSQLTHLSLNNPLQWPNPTQNPLPAGLRILSLFGAFKELGILPSSLKILKLHHTDIENLDHLPSGLEVLVFHSRFDHLILDHLPPSLTHLTIFDKFNQPLDHLPPGLIYLRLGEYDCHFNQAVDQFPASLTFLTLGFHFNQPLTSLPAFLTHLTLGFHFNQPLGLTSLPNSLTHLTFGKRFNQPLVFPLPDTITHLVFGDQFCQIFQLPLPLALIHLTLGEWYNLPINSNVLPLSLRRLTLGNAFNQPLDFLPAFLTHLISGAMFNQPVDHLLPPSLLHLSLGNWFNQPVDHLPHHLITFRVGIHFNQPVDHFPASLRLFVFGKSFDQPLDRLPPQLTLRHSDSTLYIHPSP